MEKYNARVDAYIDKSKDFAKPILLHLRALVHQASPDFTESIKWGAPFFEYNGPVCQLAAFKEHCAFGFWLASAMEDPDNILKRDDSNAGSLGRITSLEDLPSDDLLIKYIRAALELHKSGVKAPSKAAAKGKAELVIPDDFLEALAANTAAAAHFYEFSPSGKREYVEWIEEAKTVATREKRLLTAMEWIAEGKSRHWKYK